MYGEPQSKLYRPATLRTEFEPTRRTRMEVLREQKRRRARADAIKHQNETANLL